MMVTGLDIARVLSGGIVLAQIFNKYDLSILSIGTWEQRCWHNLNIIDYCITFLLVRLLELAWQDQQSWLERG